MRGVNHPDEIGWLVVAVLPAAEADGDVPHGSDALFAAFVEAPNGAGAALGGFECFAPTFRERGVRLAAGASLRRWATEEISLEADPGQRYLHDVARRALWSLRVYPAVPGRPVRLATCERARTR